MKNILFILFIGLTVSSCTFSQKQNNDFFNRVEELLKRKDYVIPDSLFSFFPDKSNKYAEMESVVILQNAKRMENLLLSEFSDVKLVEAYQCDNKATLQSLIKEYRLQSLSSVKSEDNDYFVIGSERELLKVYDTLQLKEKYSKLDVKSLTFYFKESVDGTPFLYDSTTINNLPAGYEVLVLKSGNNFVLPEDHLYEWSVLPESLRHGYRSGVAFKEGEPYIIYWTVAW